MRVIFLYIPCASQREAKAIGARLLKERLAACIHVWPIHSSYWWKGKIKDARETVLLAKTTEQLARKAEEIILKHHSYDTPCIAHLPVLRLNPSYASYIRKLTQ